MNSNSPVCSLSSYALLAGLLAVSMGQAVSAQEKQFDTAVVGTSTPKPIETNWSAYEPQLYTGRIRQLNSDSLVIQQADGNSISIRSDRVERVNFQWASPEAKQLWEQYERREYREVARSLQAALKSEIPVWQQRFLISAVVRSAMAMDNWRTAGVLFLNLAKASPPPMLLADMPLCWTARDVPASVQELVSDWIASPDEHAQLLGASWGLFGSDAAKCKTILTRLQGSDNKTIAKLAAAQSWRLVPPPQTMRQLAGWMEFRQQLIEPLRLGPSEFIADRLARIGETELATGQWLRIASQHTDRYDRSLKALQEAKKLLQKRKPDSEEVGKIEQWIQQQSD